MAEKGMSSKVLNMKFMRQAEIKEEEKQQEEQERKLKDLSEWKASGAEALKAKLLAQKRNVRTVGFQDLNRLRNGTDSPVVGRRTFGAPEKEETKLEKADDEDQSESSELDQLWKKTQLSGNQNSGKNNRKVSGSKRPNSEDGPKKNSKKRKSQS